MTDTDSIGQTASSLERDVVVSKIEYSNIRIFKYCNVGYYHYQLVHGSRLCETRREYSRPT